VYSSSSLTDAQWAVLEPLLPPPGNAAGRGGRPEKYCRRLILDAILYVGWNRLAAAAGIRPNTDPSPQLQNQPRHYTFQLT
jgi:transposase